MNPANKREALAAVVACDRPGIFPARLFASAPGVVAVAVVVVVVVAVSRAAVVLVAAVHYPALLSGLAYPRKRDQGGEE